MHLDLAAELICESKALRDGAAKAAQEHLAQWAAGELHLDPEEDVDLISGIAELLAMAMYVQRQY